MNLLQAGVSLEIIRDFLGHEGVVTTQIYARANSLSDISRPTELIVRLTSGSQN